MLISLSFPLVIKEDLGTKYCSKPCSLVSEQFFYDNEDQCRSECSHPYKHKEIHSVKVCTLDLKIKISLKEVQKAQETAETISTIGEASSSGMKAASALNSNNPSFITLSHFSSMLLYIRYLKINYPKRLLLLFLSQDSGSIGINFKVEILPTIQDNLPPRKFPDVFEAYQLHSSFLINFWDSLVILTMILTLTLFLIALSN